MDDLIESQTINTLLFTSALRPDHFAKGLSLAAGVVLADLEDSVGPSLKEEARERVTECLCQARPAGIKVAVRVNPIDGSLGLKDMAKVLGVATPPDYILVPKVESPEILQVAQKIIEDSGCNTKLLGLIESINGVLNVVDIACSSPILAGLVFGSADYTSSIGAEICWDTLYYPRAKIVLAAKLANIQAIDTPFFEIKDLKGLENENVKIKQMGFTGRCVIHPNQLEVMRETFLPSYKLFEYARRVVAEADSSKGNICKVDGHMVGPPMVKKARKLLESLEQS